MKTTPNAAVRAKKLDQAKDTAMALVLLCLLGRIFIGPEQFVTAAVVLLVLAMIWPALFVLPARLWFGLSHLMGSVVSRVLLGAVFFLVVTPVGVVRRWAGKDSLKLRAFRKGTDSVFWIRKEKIAAKDIVNPF